MELDSGKDLHLESSKEKITRRESEESNFSDYAAGLERQSMNLEALGESDISVNYELPYPMTESNNGHAHPHNIPDRLNRNRLDVHNGLHKPDRRASLPARLSVATSIDYRASTSSVQMNLEDLLKPVKLQAEPLDADGENKRKTSQRCAACNKKCKLLPFFCDCGKTFCSKHRLPEDHFCSKNTASDYAPVDLTKVEADKLSDRI